MKQRVVIALIILSAVNAITGCRTIIDSRASAPEIWLVPQGEVYHGGPGKDGIPALSNPDFTIPELATYLPLTGSGIAWDRNWNATETTFGVSGLLYNSNLVPFDRATGSHWSQMKLQCVSGPKAGEFAKTYQVLETTWKSWKEMYPETLVLSRRTGHSRPYGRYPYEDYKQTDQLLFPVSHDDMRLHRKERVFGVLVGEKTKVYPLEYFPDSLGVMNETVDGVPIVVVGSSGRNFAAGFEARLSDETLLGRGIEGPRAGKKLRPTRSFIAYWFAWGAFYPGVEIQSR